MNKPAIHINLLREKIKEKARSRGLTLAQIARKIGVSYPHLRGVLAGYYTSHPVIKKIAEVLDFPELPSLYEQLQKSKKRKKAKKKSK